MTKHTHKDPNYQPKVFANNICNALIERYPVVTVSLPTTCGEGQAFVVTCTDGTKYFVSVQEYKA